MKEQSHRSSAAGSNGIGFGDNASLQNIDASTIQEICYYPPDEALIKFCSIARAGIFDVTSQ